MRRSSSDAGQTGGGRNASAAAAAARGRRASESRVIAAMRSDRHAAHLEGGGDGDGGQVRFDQRSNRGGRARTRKGGRRAGLEGGGDDGGEGGLGGSGGREVGALELGARCLAEDGVDEEHEVAEGELAALFERMVGICSGGRNYIGGGGRRRCLGGTGNYDTGRQWEREKMGGLRRCCCAHRVRAFAGRETCGRKSVTERS